MITIYTKPQCPYCDRAKNYLKQNNFEFCEINVMEDSNALRFIREEKGHKTVPQIYYDDRLLVEGGYGGLAKLSPLELTKRVQQYANGSFI
jgi:glutaredoxin